MASVKIIYTLPDCHGWFHCVCQLLWRESACCWIHICHHSARNVYWHPCLSAGRCDWHHSMPQKEVHRHERIHNGKQTFKLSWSRSGVWVRYWLYLINPNEYEQLSSTAQEYRSNYQTPYSTVSAWTIITLTYNQKGMSYKPEAISVTSFLILALIYIQQFIMPSSFQCWPAQILPRWLTENHSTCTLQCSHSELKASES